MYKPTYMYTNTLYIHTYIPAYIQTHTSKCIYTLKYLYSLTYTQIHVYINTSTHLYTTQKYIYISACLYMSKLACLLKY